jgi:hypothetical protein
MARKPLSKRVRFEVFKRDLFTCQYCGAHPPGAVLEVDHIEAVAAGGADDETNLITACFDCNRGKAARSLSVAPESLTDRAARIAEAEDQLAGYAAVMEARRERVEADVWRVVEALTGETEIRKDHFQSVKQFVEKLGVHEVLDAAQIAAAAGIYSDNRLFRYFCGICWNKVREAGNGR